jgi:hypothetical protein
MKARKVRKKLNKIESSLTDIMDQYSPAKPQLRDLLSSAKEAVAQAKASVDGKGIARKPPVRAKTARKRPARAAGTKRVSAAASA